ncbi:uncharacterized protein N7529_002314 [Penicillium soppii]|uniref:uncharacterized protein n=1 Tax=Penicillium soppii TaxID=69789 RepID=UPI0025478B41|nr:uncharacterized protein N7529_002314 [Penicillium soppii]KAJ5873884.1 hypothetical protein N7529_002314 [Penicillium soppii]
MGARLGPEAARKPKSRMQLKELQMLLGDKLQSGKSKRVIVDAVVPPMKPKERSIELDNERGQTE